MGSNLGGITPTPEMIAMAERIADGLACNTASEWSCAQNSALAAIIETTERAAALAEADDDLFVAVGLHNGEHLR